MMHVLLFGGGLNPPGIHHLKMAKSLSPYFDEVVILPCGLREDKESVGCILSIHRKKMNQLTFSNLEKTKLDFSDIDNSKFTPTHELQKRYESLGKVFHLVGSDLTQNGGVGKSKIQTIWKYGKYIWENYNFVVINRPDYPITSKDLPPNNQVFDFNFEGSSSKIRKRLENNQLIIGLVTNEVEKYIYKNKLYMKEEVES